MDESKPSISLGEFRLRTDSERISANIDPPPAELAKSDELAADDFSDGPSVTVYYRNEEQVREGFLIALAAMGIAPFEQPPEPEQPPVGGAKP
jgi:hypothetical protein